MKVACVKKSKKSTIARIKKVKEPNKSLNCPKTKSKEIPNKKVNKAQTKLLTKDEKLKHRYETYMRYVKIISFCLKEINPMFNPGVIIEYRDNDSYLNCLSNSNKKLKSKIAHKKNSNKNSNDIISYNMPKYIQLEDGSVKDAHKIRNSKKTNDFKKEYDLPLQISKSKIENKNKEINNKVQNKSKIKKLMDSKIEIIKSQDKNPNKVIEEKKEKITNTNFKNNNKNDEEEKKDNILKKIITNKNNDMIVQQKNNFDKLKDKREEKKNGLNKEKIQKENNNNEEIEKKEENNIEDDKKINVDNENVEEKNSNMKNETVFDEKNSLNKSQDEREEKDKLIEEKKEKDHNINLPLQINPKENNLKQVKENEEIKKKNLNNTEENKEIKDVNENKENETNNVKNKNNEIVKENNNEKKEINKEIEEINTEINKVYNKIKEISNEVEEINKEAGEINNKNDEVVELNNEVKEVKKDDENNNKNIGTKNEEKNNEIPANDEKIDFSTVKQDILNNENNYQKCKNEKITQKQVIRNHNININKNDPIQNESETNIKKCPHQNADKKKYLISSNDDDNNKISEKINVISSKIGPNRVTKQYYIKRLDDKLVTSLPIPIKQNEKRFKNYIAIIPDNLKNERLCYSCRHLLKNNYRQKLMKINLIEYNQNSQKKVIRPIFNNMKNNEEFKNINKVSVCPNNNSNVIKINLPNSRIVHRYFNKKKKLGNYTRNVIETDYYHDNYYNNYSNIDNHMNALNVERVNSTGKGRTIVFQHYFGKGRALGDYVGNSIQTV